jgi:alpha-N-acetylglucosaminidase
MGNYYDPDDTREAAKLMVSVADKYKGNNNFEYDLVDIVRQAIADQGRVQYLQTIADFNAFSKKAFEKDSKRFLDLLLMQDKLLGTRSEFRLGHWTEAARSLGTTEAEKDQYEWNARTQITTWGNRVCADDGGLRDYAHKEWNGILKDFYYKRWSTYFASLEDQLNGKPKVDIDFYGLEEPWTKQTNQYSSKPEGNCVDMAKEAIKMICHE